MKGNGGARLLPPNIEPLAPSWKEAADLWGIGATMFDALVETRFALALALYIRGSDASTLCSSVAAYQGRVAQFRSG
jgi:hypothetical protein